MTCRGGQWTGADPKCEDIDECDGVDCGGSSNCTNSIGKYICECAEGWSGGGINKTCEKGYCKCTGNKGYWKAQRTVVNGEIYVGYNHGENYGEKCLAHDIQAYEPDDPDTAYHQEPWYE